MNRRQLFVLWIAVLAVAAMCAFPPWTIDDGGIRRLDDGYHFLLRPPKQKTQLAPDGTTYTYMVSSRIDSSRLLVQCAIVGVIAAGLIASLRSKPDRQQRPADR
ncbi:MAG TPA: hypothetical protein VNA25_18490 [Phycisphaerae bacterium]|nr:hypothetical protein [Phycisphaerae bacterium]